MCFQWLKWTNTSAFQVVGTQKKPLLLHKVSETDVNAFLFSVRILSSLAERLKGKTQPWVGEVIRSRSLSMCKCPCIFCCRCITTRHSNTGLHLASPSSMVKVPTAIQPPIYVEMCFHHVWWVPWLPFPKEMHSQSYGTWVFTHLMVSTVTYS